MTLRDTLERAHCCEELLEFATRHACWCDEWEGAANWHEAQTTCPADTQRPILETLADLWNAIERHDWLTWLMRHCPDQFEDSWRDCVSALHAVAAGHAADYRPGRGFPEVETCHLIRSYIRLRRQS